MIDKGSVLIGGALGMGSLVAAYMLLISPDAKQGECLKRLATMETPGPNDLPTEVIDASCTHYDVVRHQGKDEVLLVPVWRPL